MENAASPSTPIDIRYVAKLARLALDDHEIVRYEQELGTLLAHVAELAELPTDDVDATAQVIASRNVSRPDEVRTGLARADFLDGAPAVQASMVRVPRILAEAE